MRIYISLIPRQRVPVWCEGTGKGLIFLTAERPAERVSASVGTDGIARR